MMDFDLFVIGGGSGGVRAARMAAAAGAHVAIAEEYRYGGTCVIRGCVPKKLLSYASHFHEEFEDAAGFGWQAGGASFDWARLIANKDREILRLEGIYEKLLSDAGVEIFKERATFEGPNEIRLGTRRISAERILIATGGAPVFPPGDFWTLSVTSNEVFHLESMPARVLVNGGGYIAVEFAGIFNGLGAEVTQVYRGPRVLRGFDEDVRSHLTEEMTKKGIGFRFDTNITNLCREGDAIRVSFDRGEDQVVDLVLSATGRRPNTAGLGLEAAGVETDSAGAVQVDAFSRTSQDHIYAVGDVTDRIALTPVAIHEAMAFVDTVFKGTPRAMDYDNVPSAVFSHPNVATVGLTEAEASKRFAKVEVYRSSFRPMKHTLSGRDEKSLMKLLVDGDSRKVVGLHMVGPDAPEIVQGMAIAIKAGATKEVFDATVGIHPTAAEEFVTMRQPVGD